MGRRAQIGWAWALIHLWFQYGSSPQRLSVFLSAVAELSSRPEMADGRRIETYEDFVEVHGLLLIASGLPQSLHRQLFQKLTSETFDGGAHFQVEPFEDGRSRRLVLSSDFMAKESNVFLVDHAWTFRLSDACKQLLEVPGLAERMASLMCVDVDMNLDEEEEEEDHSNEDEAKQSVWELVESEIRGSKEKGNDSARWLEVEDLQIDDDTLVSLDLPTKFPDLLALSLTGNKLRNVDVVAQEVSKFKHLRALWLNDNPVAENCDENLQLKVLEGSPNLEIYNSRFTHNFSEWALGFCGDIYGKDNPGSIYPADHTLQCLTSLDLSNRRIHNLINKAFSPVELPSLSYLNLRGNPLEQNSVGDLLKILKEFPCLSSLEVDIPGPLGEKSVDIIESLPNLNTLNGIDVAKVLNSGKHVLDSLLLPRLPEWSPEEALPDRIINAMWLYLMTYRLADDEKIDETSVWYVMDELGSALRHSDEPNFRVAPFLFMPDGKLESAISFTILWPIHNIQKGDECTRDCLFGIGEDKQRSARLTAWFHTPQNYFVHEYEKHIKNLQSKALASSPISQTASNTEGQHRSKGGTLRVYTDNPQVEEYLNRPEFILTSDPKEADIIWTSMQIDEDTKKASGITDQQYVNQFPFEACLVMKHHLAETVEKAYGCPEWLQRTYNLETHLSQLIGDYFVRKRDGLNNLWILKPWNMARTIDTTVTDNLSAIIRLMETGPKICQKYIEHPALFNGKKFDLRYIVLVRSMQPLEIFLADTFWVRLANNPYSLEKQSFFEYETHFTVMNYRGKFIHKSIKEFVKEFEQEHNVKWLDIHSRVTSMFRSVFESAATVHPEMQNPSSRAMYGLDVMLDSSFQPKLLEVTYCPDCTRACKYDVENVFEDGGVVKGQEFYNYAFGCLFLNETTHVTPL